MLELARRWSLIQYRILCETSHKMLKAVKGTERLLRMDLRSDEQEKANSSWSCTTSVRGFTYILCSATMVGFSDERLRTKFENLLQVRPALANEMSLSI